MQGFFSFLLSHSPALRFHYFPSPPTLSSETSFCPVLFPGSALSAGDRLRYLYLGVSLFPLFFCLNMMNFCASPFGEETDVMIGGRDFVARQMLPGKETLKAFSPLFLHLGPSGLFSIPPVPKSDSQ